MTDNLTWQETLIYLSILGMGLWLLFTIEEQEMKQTPTPCVYYAESAVKNVPARCLEHFLIDVKALNTK